MVNLSKLVKRHVFKCEISTGMNKLKINIASNIVIVQTVELSVCGACSSYTLEITAVST